MTPADVNTNLMHRLVVQPHAQGITDLPDACTVDPDDRTLRIEPGRDFADDTWQLPTRPALPGETLTQAPAKVSATTGTSSASSKFREDSRSSLGLILLGQPTLRRRLKQGHFAALDQRIGLRFHLDGLPLEETAAYIGHHLTLAGRSDPLFSDDAIALIHQTSRGIPRAINNLAVQALIAAYADSKGIVDESAAKAAITEVAAD